MTELRAEAASRLVERSDLNWCQYHSTPAVWSECCVSDSVAAAISLQIWPTISCGVGTRQCARLCCRGHRQRFVASARFDGTGKSRLQAGTAQPNSAGRPQPPRPEPPRPARAGPDRSQGRGRGMSSGGSGRGGAGSAAGEARQGSVKDMIQRLDGHRRDGDRRSSPSKRPRNDSDRDSMVSSSASIDDPAPGQPLTHQSLAAIMRTMSRQIRDDIADQFRVLREEISGMSDRIRSLEQHVDERDNYI